MKTRVLAFLALAFVAALFVLPTLTFAEDDVKLTGTVSVTKDDDGNLTAVKLTVGETVYNVALCANGKKLGAELAGKKAEVTGTVKEEDDVKTLSVKSFKACEEEKTEE
ncbi:MAG TPA: hypothetical protein VNE39_03065 [Planctomycetota bacterium]|nr:hypothetical protein [Planctomycetota bacterium]